ncbi:MAG: hypothetical protein E6X17_04160 [Sporomusaceae bacterium]|nr:hypothetical protein [Sporomusaceae bacterium]
MQALNRFQAAVQAAFAIPRTLVMFAIFFQIMAAAKREILFISE